MKVTHIDHGEWTEKRFEPDPPAGNGKGGEPKVETKPKIDIAAWPVLDKTAYYGLAGEVVTTLLPETEADPAALLLQYLASFGNMVGRTSFVEWASSKHYPNIFTLIAGRSARSRKGTSAQNIRAVIERADSDWARENVKSGISSGEGIIEMVRDARYEMNKRTQTVVCVDPGVFDKRLLLDEREFSSTLSKMKQETNIVSTILRQAWDCYPPVLATRTKIKPSVATEPLISVAAHITLNEVRQLLDKLSITDGFGNRFLYGCTDRSKLLPFGGNFDPAVLDALATKTREAMLAAQQLGQITMADDAKPCWQQFYEVTEGPVQHAEHTTELIDHLTARAAPQVLRLALIYALLDKSAQMTLPHVEAAIAVWQFCEASAKYIFRELSSDHTANTILCELQRIRPDGLNRRSLMHETLARHVSAYDLSCALQKLEAAGKIRCERNKPNGRGRPGEMWFAT
jgi:hypothetical protein